MIPVMFNINSELNRMLEIPEALPLDDLRGSELWFHGQFLGWQELPNPDGVGGKYLPGGYWEKLINGELIKIPKVVHQPTGSVVRYAKVEHKELGRFWIIFDDRDGRLWNSMLDGLGYSHLSGNIPN